MQTLVFVTLSGLLVSCSSSQIQQGKATHAANEKTNAVPQFSIAGRLSENAQKRLQGMHESVLVIVYFDGDPLPGKGKDNSPMRGVVLGTDEKLVDVAALRPLAIRRFRKATGMTSRTTTTM